MRISYTTQLFLPEDGFGADSIAIAGAKRLSSPIVVSASFYGTLRRASRSPNCPKIRQSLTRSLHPLLRSLHDRKHFADHRDGGWPDEHDENAWEDEDHEREDQLHRGLCGF